MKYEIKVTQINDDGSREPFVLGEGEKTLDAIECGGFCLIGTTETEEGLDSAIALHDTSPYNLELAIHNNPILMDVARHAVLREALKKLEKKDAAE